RKLEGRIMTWKEKVRHALGPWLGFRPWRRHSLVLMVGGLVFALYGFNITQWHVDGPRAQGVQIAVDLVPSMTFWGSIWVFVGLLAMLSSRWPVMSENWGYAALTGWSLGWAATYFGGLIVA